MDQIDSFRALTRDLTRAVGVLGGDLHQTGRSLSELRVLYEISLKPWTARALSEDLGLDEGYVSRIVSRLQRAGLCTRQTHVEDRRLRVLALTPLGRARVAEYVDLMRTNSARVLGAVPPVNAVATAEAMGRLRHHLSPDITAEAPVTYRDLGPGDAGWIAMRFAELFRADYGLDQSFEPVVLAAITEYLQGHDPARDRVWIAERAGLRLGSIILMHTETPGLAKLRLFFVDPLARGQGIGTALVDHCIAFARAVGYEKVTLWTQGQLHAAIRQYQRVGFVCVASDETPAFGQAHANQTWELTL